MGGEKGFVRFNPSTTFGNCARVFCSRFFRKKEKPTERVFIIIRRCCCCYYVVVVPERAYAPRTVFVAEIIILFKRTYAAFCRRTGRRITAKRTSNNKRYVYVIHVRSNRTRNDGMCPNNITRVRDNPSADKLWTREKPATFNYGTLFGRRMAPTSRSITVKITINGAIRRLNTPPRRVDGFWRTSAPGFRTTHVITVRQFHKRTTATYPPINPFSRNFRLPRFLRADNFTRTIRALKNLEHSSPV